MTFFLAMLIKPFLALAVALISWPIVSRVRRMKDGKLKRLLLRRIS